MISREDQIEQSVQQYVQGELVAKGYGPGVVKFVDSFPYQQDNSQSNISLIATGFNFDDGGEMAELGSTLRRRVVTIQFFIFGSTLTFARNLASLCKYACERDGVIPLLDIGTAGQPVIDSLYVEHASQERQIVPDAEPFQENIYTVHLKILDEYDAQLVV